MRNIWAIAWKETKTYFASPMAYIVGAVFVGITGFFFVDAISVPFPVASVRGFLDRAVLLVMPVWAPIITMRLLAEEQKLGTLELLMTAPVRDYEIVLGKFLATLFIFLGTLLLTLWFVLLLFFFGDPDPLPLLVAYLGFILYGAAALAVGLLASSLSPNQIVAAAVGFGVLLLLTFMQQAADQVKGAASTILGEVALTGHMDDFLRGILSTKDVGYYVSLVALFLFLTVRLVESRRWR
ncbi:MAG: hypothetical protein EXR55_02050 [Dehalococcoidia bacterium]|nr:hypothetical protein [Dehalococcoidia bacterium]